MCWQVGAWIGGGLDSRMGGLKGEWLNWSVDGCVVGCWICGGLVSGLLGGPIHGWGGWIDGGRQWIDGWQKRWDRWWVVDGWSRRVVGWMDVWIDGAISRWFNK
ncbi:hypothetical protein QAD02_023248 [Eretmocerus hayati]|uniref:Uncharacterized protein n=1 Tax=Eretmocerus hayati TaxID=131215 RepID=A0ACC2PXS2_9HYME|nr:hypothetical protein QAD02_023248 [Eretmocerus hayati]